MDKYRTITSSLEKLQDKEKADREAAYMRNKFKFYGIPAPKRRAAYKEFLSQEKKNKVIDWDLLDQCWDAEHREMQYFVKDYLEIMHKHLTYGDIPRLERFIRTKQWWDSIDGLDRIIGGIAFTDKRINDLMLRWSTDSDFWVRRIAIDHQLCRKAKTDTELLEKILVNNFGSNEFFINKAIGWSLRDYSKTNPEWVRNFIDKYRDKMSALSIREGSKYI
ncbi:MAG: DNA alkylation repair protein [Muribaculaceae bacterium]|nr:DNA alkylation repair protein [Muribaculaceae bacterium]